MNDKEKLLTDEELDHKSEHRFYVKMRLRDRIQIRDNMDKFKIKYKSSLSEVLRKVMLEHLDDEEFIEYLGIHKRTEG